MQNLSQIADNCNGVRDPKLNGYADTGLFSSNQGQENGMLSQHTVQHLLAALTPGMISPYSSITDGSPATYFGELILLESLLKSS